MDYFNPDHFRISDTVNGAIPVDKRLPRHKRREKFLKGPIPWAWLSPAASLPGKALQVAVALWFQAGIKGDPTVNLSCKVLRDMGVKRNAGYRGLAKLEGAGLVSAVRRRGRLPIVTILEPK